MDSNRFGRRLASLRQARGLTQEVLGKRAGVDRRQVVRWESGENGTTNHRLEHLCDLLDVTISQFWDESWHPNVSDNGEFRGGHSIEVDENNRAFSCPNCGEKQFSDRARYCPACRYPLFNFCIAEARHKNVPTAQYCEICSEKTFWHLSDSERKEEEIQKDYHTSRIQPAQSETQS